MRKLTALLGAALIAASSLALAPVAHAGDIASSNADLAGRWRSAALKMNGLGYGMTVRHMSGMASNTYRARVAFLGAAAVPDTVGGTNTITVYGRDLVWTWTGGSKSMRLHGTLGMDGSMYFPTCYKLLIYASKASRAEDCLFQEMPTRR